jgi:hypothetical protein
MEVATFGPPLGWVLGQRATKGQDPTEAALALLKRMPLPGQRVTLDAGRIGSPVIRKVVEKKRSPEGRSRAICRSWCRRSGYGSRIRGYGSGPQMFGRPEGARSAGAPGAEAGEARGTGLIPGGGGWRAWAEALWLDPTVPLWAVEAGSTRSMGGAVTPPAQDSKARELMTRADEGGQRPDRWHFPRTLRRPGPSHPKSPAGSLGPSHLTDSQNLIMIVSKP